MMPTEACDSISREAWCCHKDGDFNSSRYCMNAITSFIARGANYLLNIAPEADGRLQKEYTDVLDKVTPWFKRVREALYAPYRPWVLFRDTFLCTGDRNTLYVFLLEAPAATAFPLVPLDTAPESAMLLNNGQELTVEFRGTAPHKNPVVILRHYPADEFYNEIPVVKLTFKEDINEVIARVSAHDYLW